MTDMTRPSLPLPPPLRGEETGTFTYHSVVERLPDIARHTLAENDFPAGVVSAIETLVDDIPEGSIRPLHDGIAPDAAAWIAHVAPYVGQTWLQVPWFFAETYFYRRILEATGYFRPGREHERDPFAPQKQRELETARPALHDLAARLAAWHREDDPRTILTRLFPIVLWGNQADLSMWPGGEGKPAGGGDGQTEARVLVDDSATVADHLLSRHGAARVDFLMDNAGFELLSDLALTEFLLRSGTAATVTLHIKAHPTFVSDAIRADVHAAISFLAADEDDPTRALARRLRAHLADDRLRLRSDPFWTSPLPGWEMTGGPKAALRRADLVISKGDANYRRLLGDRHWPFTTPFAAIVSYFPAPLVAVRTLKSEVAAGIPPGRVSQLNDEHPGWTTSGEWGVIQFAP